MSELNYMCKICRVQLTLKIMFSQHVQVPVKCSDLRWHTDQTHSTVVGFLKEEVGFVPLHMVEPVVEGKRQNELFNTRVKEMEQPPWSYLLSNKEKGGGEEIWQPHIR